MFWFHVACRYNADQPAGMVDRNESMVRNVIGRANEEIQKFQGYYLEEQLSAESAMSEVDIITTAMSVYQSMDYKQFKHLNTWQEVRHHPKYKGGVRSFSSSSSKRLRTLSYRGEDEVACQLVEAHLDSPDAGPSASQRRPQGRKQATTCRHCAATPAEPPAPAPTPFVPPPPPPTVCWPFCVKPLTPIHLR